MSLSLLFVVQISGQLNRDGRVLEVGGITGNNHVNVGVPGRFVQHGVFKIFERQTQCAFQNCFADRGDLEERQ